MVLLSSLVALLCLYAPVCAAEACSRFRHMENGQTFFRYGGLMVIFRCNPGYKLHGYKTSSCVSGHWSRDPPVCVGSGCSIAGPLTDGTSSVNEDGSWVTFSCNSGFGLHGPSMLYCKGHNWNSTKPVCKESDMMSSVSGVSVQKPNVHQNLQAAAALKTQQQLHPNTITYTASSEANLTFGWLSQTPSQMSNSERIKETQTKVHLQQHVQFPSFKVKDGVQTTPHEADEAQGKETGSGSHASEQKAEKVDEVASKSHLSSTASSTSSLVSGTQRSTSSPPSCSTAAITAVTNTVMFAPTSPLHQIKSALPVSDSERPLKFGEPFRPWEDVTPSEEIPGSSQTADEDQKTQTGSEYPLSPSEEPTETSMTLSTSLHLVSLSSSSTSALTPLLSPSLPSFSAPTSSGTSSTQSNMKTQLPEIPSNPSSTTETRSNQSHNCSMYPPVPAHGTFYFHNIENPGPGEYRHYIQYACYPGYILAHGDVHRYCQLGGTWSGITPVCLESTPCSVNCSQLCSHSQHHNQSSNQTQTRTQCQCRAGFTLLDDGRTCRDIDECAVNQGLGPCGEQCHNSPGSYRCSCSYGHILAGNGHSCIAECPPGYRKQPTTPLHNSTTHALKEECVDINECQEEPCEWQCVNLPGSHRCICPRGYTLHRDGQRCEDLDECVEGWHQCQHRCINTFGSFKCSCDDGYQLAHDQTTCRDVDECRLPEAVTGCVFECVNTLGSFQCQCPAGYSLQTADSRCQDIDECAVNQGLGPCGEQCHNSPGSYRCSCSYGHILAGNGHSCIAECPPGYRKQPTTPLDSSTTHTLKEACVDINECQEEPCEWQCVNLPGSHRCICPRGYTLHRDGRRCEDINECSRKNGGCSHLCVNQKGGYKCACPASHRLSHYSWKKCVPNSAG